MQRIERKMYSISSAPAEQEAGWYDRLMKLVARPARKPKMDTQEMAVDGLNDHMQTLMVSDLFLRK